MTFTSSTDSRAKGMIASSRAAISTMRWTFQGTSFRTPPPRALLRGPSLGLNMRPWEGRSSAQTSWGLSVEHDLWKKASKPRGLQQIGSSSLPVSPRQLLISGILLTSGTAPDAGTNLALCDSYVVTGPDCRYPTVRGAVVTALSPIAACLPGAT